MLSFTVQVYITRVSLLNVLCDYVLPWKPVLFVYRKFSFSSSVAKFLFFIIRILRKRSCPRTAGEMFVNFANVSRMKGPNLEWHTFVISYDFLLVEHNQVKVMLMVLFMSY